MLFILLLLPEEDMFFTFWCFSLLDTKKDDTFGADDKDWDVYKEIVSLDVIIMWFTEEHGHRKLP